MIQSTFMQISPKELANFISNELKMELIKFAANPKVKDLISTNKPQLIRKGIGNFFNFSLNYIKYWPKKRIFNPFKVGQRACFKKHDILNLLFT